jgi:four helix bundle protein
VQLFKDIYTFTEKWPTGTSQLFAMVMDIRRTAMAIPNDITECLNRHQEESLEFLLNSQEALVELESLLLTAKNHKDLDMASFQPLLTEIEKLKIKLLALKSSLADV